MSFPTRHVRRLGALLDEIDAIAQQDGSLSLQRRSVSAWSVAEQLDHAVRVCSSILGRIHQPAELVEKPLNLVGRLVILAGWIPRGKGKSPKSLLPLPCSREELRQSVSETRRLLDRVVAEAPAESKDRIVRHPLFGGLTARQSLQFAIIHTHHHIRIVRDILAVRS